MTVSTRITQHNVDHTSGYFAITVSTLVNGEEQDYRLGTPSQEYSYLFNDYERIAWLSVVVTNRPDDVTPTVMKYIVEMFLFSEAKFEKIILPNTY